MKGNNEKIKTEKKPPKKKKKGYTNIHIYIKKNISPHARHRMLLAADNPTNRMDPSKPMKKRTSDKKKQKLKIHRKQIEKSETNRKIQT